MSDLAHGMAHGGGRRGSIWKNLLKKKEGKGRQRYDREEESESECEERHQRFGREEVAADPRDDILYQINRIEKRLTNIETHMANIKARAGKSKSQICWKWLFL